MSIRDLLFIGLVLGGGAALCASLLPPREGAKAGPVVASADTRQAAEERAVAHRIDAEFHRSWAVRGVMPVGKAPELAILRRLSLGLTGTIPSLEEIRRFESRAEGTRLDAWLAETLDDRRHADYFAERLARSYVGTEGGPFLVFRRRRLVTWLSDELMARRPYDRIVRDLIASDGLWTDRPATNFLTVTYDPEKKRFDAERLAARVARAFLGARLDCAQCHDHPFQAWKQGDFQGLAAFFGPLRSGFTGVSDDLKEGYAMTDRKANKPVTVAPRVPFSPELLPDGGPPRARLAGWITDPKNPHLARATANRVWALLFGRPLVEPVDDLAAAEEIPPALEILADDFRAHGYNLRRLVRVIAATEAFRLDSAGDPEPTEAQESSWAAFPMTRLRPEQIAGGIIQSASLATIDADSHILARLGRSFGQSEFVQRFGDTGDEFDVGCGTITQRLQVMNGKLMDEKTKDTPFNAGTQIGFLAPDDARAVEVAYLTILTRRPTPAESSHFIAQLHDLKGNARGQRMSDLSWTLLNSTEFSWNH